MQRWTLWLGLLLGLLLGFAAGIGITDAHLEIDRRLIDTCDAMAAKAKLWLDAREDIEGRDTVHVRWDEARAAN